MDASERAYWGYDPEPEPELEEAAMTPDPGAGIDPRKLCMRCGATAREGALCPQNRVTHYWKNGKQHTARFLVTGCCDSMKHQQFRRDG